jgi:hypothetical protein
MFGFDPVILTGYTVVYHCTDHSKRASILEEGLLARYPREHNFKHDPAVFDQPRGVYCSKTFEGRWHAYDEHLDVWAVNVAGLVVRQTHVSAMPSLSRAMCHLIVS